MFCPTLKSNAAVNMASGLQLLLGDCCLYHTSVKSNNTTKVQLLAVNIFSP